MKKNIQEEAHTIALFSKNAAKKYCKTGTVKQALKSLGLTQKAFIENPRIHAEKVAQAVSDVTQGVIEVSDDRSEGRKARDWYARKQGMNKQEKDLLLPKSAEIEVYAKDNNCTVFQAIARMSTI